MKNSEVTFVQKPQLYYTVLLLTSFEILGVWFCRQKLFSFWPYKGGGTEITWPQIIHQIVYMSLILLYWFLKQLSHYTIVSFCCCGRLPLIIMSTGEWLIIIYVVPVTHAISYIVMFTIFLCLKQINVT